MSAPARRGIPPADRAAPRRGAGGGLRVVQGNRTEDLLAALAEDLAAWRARPGARRLEAPSVVVPDRQVETYVKLGIARLTGLAANLEVRFLKRFVARLVAGGGSPLALLDATALQGLLLTLLLDEELLAGAGLEPVRAYLAAEGEGARDLRRHQLSGELARLFEEYAYSRPDLLRAWRQGALLLDGGPAASAERWQRRLWAAIHGTGGLLERRAAAGGPTWVSVADLLEPEAGPLWESIQVPARVHLFGFPYLGEALVHLLAALAGRGAEVRLYSLSPCAEYWEDVASRRGRADALADDDDAPALRLWGRPGREHARLLGEVTGYDAIERYRDPLADGDTLLRRLQHGVLVRAPGGVAGGRPLRADESLALLACPGARREAEIVASEIWRLVEEDPGLRLNEIAVLVADPDRAAYLTHLAAAFRECHDLPHSVVDLPLGADSRALEALELLLDLPLGRFTRAEVLRVLTHPAVGGARFADLDPEVWIRACDRLGIVHGVDRQDHEGTYVDGDVLNWDQGLRRLALGAFMTGARSGDERALELAGERYLPEEHGPGEREALARLGLLARSLLADARTVRAARLPLPRWVELLELVVATYVRPVGEVEEGHLRRGLRALGALAGIGVDPRRALSYRLVRELARDALAGLEGRRGHYLAEGVVVSGLRPMRAVPFRVVFLVGLGEGRFPAADARTGLDLREAGRRAGDVSPRDRDRYTFLEAVLSARDRLLLSWVARDPLTGDALEPSSVVAELRELLVRSGLPPAELERLVTRHPLRRWDPRYFPELVAPDAEPAGDGPALPTRAARRAAPPSARAEAQLRALGDGLRRHLGGAPVPGPWELARHLAPEVWAALAPRLRLFELPAPSAAALATADAAGLAPAPAPAAGLAPAPVARARVSIATLRRFLECPLQAHARHALRLEEVEEDVGALEDEPLATPALDGLVLLRDVMARALLGGADPAVVHDERILLRQRRGRAPVGLFAEVERVADRRLLEAWARQVRDAAGGTAPAVSRLRFGPAAEHAVAASPRDPLVLDVRGTGARGAPGPIEIVGRTELLLDGGAGSILLGRRRGPHDRPDTVARLARDALRGFLDQVILAATDDRAGGREHAIHALYPDGAVRLALAPIDRDEARAYLATLVERLLGGAHEYQLPCEAAFLWHLAGGARTVASCVDEVGRWPFSSSSGGPIARPERYPLPAEDEAAAWIRERHGPFLDRAPLAALLRGRAS